MDEDDNQENQEYQMLVLLDELESLLEDLEEHGITELESTREVPDAIRQHMDKLGLRDVQQVRDKLMILHAEVDEDERDLEISDS
jgi:hypothetical protein